VAYGYQVGGVRPGLYPLTPAVMRDMQGPHLRAVIEHTVGAAWLSIHRASGLFWVSVPNPRPYTVNATAFDGDGLEAAIGVDRMLRPVDVDLQRSPHLLLAMPSGGGKTTATQALLYRLAAQNPPAALRFIVIASDTPKWQAMEALPHLWALVHHQQAAPVLAWILAEVERREALGITEPRIVLVLDDAHSMVTRGRVAVEVMTSLSQQARRAGVHLVVTAHGTDTANLGSADVDRNVTRRIVAATSASNAAQMTGRGKTGAEDVTDPGEAVSIDNGRATPVTLAVVTPADIETLGTRWGMAGVEPAPWSLQPAPTASNRFQPAPTVATGGWRGPNLAVSAVDAAPVAATVATVARLPRREPTVDDMEVIRANYALCDGSKSRTCRETWGAKDGDTWRWLALALEEDEA
jgi:DNA polymerase III delta prime subunit